MAPALTPSFGRLDSANPWDFSPFVQAIMALDLISAGDLNRLPQSILRDLHQAPKLDQVLSILVDWRVLTPFQASRILHGITFGLKLGDYRILDRLGSGGMAVVLRGEHSFHRTPVAVKLFSFHQGHDHRPLNRFLSEIRILRNLDHSHIVRVLDAGATRETDSHGSQLYYFVMEFIQGSDLHQHIRSRGPVPIPVACRWMTQLASALEEAHRHQLLHRDIKPANIMVTLEGNIKLLDFGIARLPTFDHSETPAGTREFMAPEQFHSPGEIDIRSDLYALGCVLYWCLTGKVPFPPTTNPVADLNRRMQPPVGIRASQPTVPRGLESVLTRLMAVLPENRFAHPREVIEALQPFQS